MWKRSSSVFWAANIHRPEVDHEQDGGSYLISAAKSFKRMQYKNNMAATLVSTFMETTGDVQLTGFWVHVQPK